MCVLCSVLCVQTSGFHITYNCTFLRKVLVQTSCNKTTQEDLMMDDVAPTHKKRKLVKTYKNVLPQKWNVVTEVCWET